MADHFTLRVHPENLRDAARKLRALADHCQEQGRQLTATPGSIGDDWTGDSAVTVKAEMTALGGHVSGFAEKFRAAASALTSLAGDYEEAQSQIASLNAKYEAADTAYDQAVSAADRSRQQNLDSLRNRGEGNQPVNRAIRDELDQARSRAVGDAFEARRTEQRNLNQSYSLTKQWLAHRTRETGRTVDDTLVITVTPEQVAEYRATSVPPLGMDLGALQGLAMATQKREAEIEELAQQDAADDLAELERLLGDNPGEIADTAALMALLEEMGGRAEDLHYSEALVRALGPDGLNRLYDQIDLSLSSMWGDGSHVPTDWAKSLQKFNDVVASGLGQYNDRDLLEFASKAAWGDGSPARLGLVASSDFADSRLSAVALSWLGQMNQSKYAPGDPTPDVARYVLGDRYDGVEEMARDWASKVDPDETVAFLNNLDPARAREIIDGIIDTGWRNHQDGPFHQDTWKIKRDLWVELLDSAVSSETVQVADALFASIEHGIDSTGEMTDEFYDALAERFNDPAFIEFLAGNRVAMDQERIGHVASLVKDQIDVQQVIADLIRHNHGTSDKNIAGDVGYLLGLTDVAGTEIDFGPVYVAMLDAAVGKAIEKVPGAGELYSILKSLIDAGAEADQAYEDWGKGWATEQQNQVLAYAVYVSEHGEPPGYAEWAAENENRIGSANPEHAITLYIEHLSDFPKDSPESTAWDQIEQIQDRISSARGTGQK